MEIDRQSTPPIAPFLVSREGGGGMTADQVRSGRFIAPSRGVRIPRELATDPDARRLAALLATSDRAVLSDLDAASWFDLPLPPWIALNSGPTSIAIAVPAGSARPQREGVRGRRLLLPKHHVTTHRGRQVTTPARTWLDCAALLPPEHLVVLGDAALRRNLTSPAELSGLVTWARRRRGVRNARQALPLLDGRAASPGESLVRVHLVNAGIPAPECNMDVVEAGQWLARADLAWRSAKVIVEYDGIVHLEERQRQKDAARRNLLQDAGWLVITFTGRDLARPWLMAPVVRSALQSRGQQLGQTTAR